MGELSNRVGAIEAELRRKALADAEQAASSRVEQDADRRRQAELWQRVVPALQEFVAEASARRIPKSRFDRTVELPRRGRLRVKRRDPLFTGWQIGWVFAVSDQAAMWRRQIRIDTVQVLLPSETRRREDWWEPIEDSPETVTTFLRAPEDCHDPRLHHESCPCVTDQEFPIVEALARWLVTPVSHGGHSLEASQDGRR